MSDKEEDTHKEDYKEKQHNRPKDRWVKKNPRGLKRKQRRELAKRIRRGR